MNQEILIAQSYKLEDGSIVFSKWQNLAEADKEFRDKATHRQVYYNEIVLDIDKNTTNEAKESLTSILNKLRHKGYEFKAYFTGSKGFHIHLIFEGLEKYPEDFRKKIKEYFISKYECDLAKATTKCLIAWEGKPHWKTGTPKTLLEEYKGNNNAKKLIEEYELSKQEAEEKKRTDPSVIGYQVMQLLLSKQRPDATELIVKTFLEQNIIYTTRRTENAEMFIYREGIFKPDAETHIKEYCNILLGKSLTTQIINEVLLKITVRSYIEEKDFFKIVDINKIAVQNGVIDLELGTLLNHDPKYYFFNKLPVIYDKEQDCINIKQFLRDILKDDSDILVIQELFGYLLYRKYIIKKAVMLTGTGDNGKSKLIELMRTFIGPENCTNLPPEKLESDPYAIGELFNKMANLGADIGDTYLKDLSLFKSLTGRDLVSGQRKFKNNINFENFAKFVFSANQLPNSKDKTKAFWSRWVVLDLPFTFVSKKEYDFLKDKTNYKIADEKILDKLSTTQEMSGLLNFAIEGLHRLLKQGDFCFNKSTQEVEDIWLRRASSINAFLKDCIEVKSGEWILKDGFHEAYADYCNQHNVKPVDDKKIKHTLSELGVYEKRKSIDGNQEWILNRIKFKDENLQNSKDRGGISNLYRSTNSIEESKLGIYLDYHDDKNSEEELINDE